MNGFSFGFGAAYGVIAAVSILSLAILMLSRALEIGVDDTDQSSSKRSGMALYTDNKTGLQYLGTPHGGITPRLDFNGHHMRIEK